ncbi:hypothetical protein KO505_01210 [Psychrosphaera sp. F3M07]|jgi:hypothetical protein|uniref:hypothetical protein n=1 Tax=Psychrosphaera sp. F3M07 TaxID=2841560 RepID=UPI001C09F492|nr:hypothetical protein [Psychrosphaera sp. F3M07]MBU2916576.1 hypothetical protein [Psychrosphaera sp. F3M07]
MKLIQSICLVISLTSVISCNSDSFVDGDFYYGRISYQCGPTDQLVLEVIMTDRKILQCDTQLAEAHITTNLEGMNMDAFVPSLRLYPHNYGNISQVTRCDEIGDCVQDGQMSLEIEQVLFNNIEGTYQIETIEETTKGRFSLLMCKDSIEYYLCG